MLTKHEKELVTGLISTRIIQLGNIILNSDADHEVKVESLKEVKELSAAKAKLEMEG